MEKFLSIPVTNEQNQLVSCSDIKLIEQVSTTTVVITYGGGKVVTLTHAPASAGDETQRDKIQDKVIKALSTKWHEVVLPVSDLPYAVSGIAIA